MAFARTQFVTAALLAALAGGVIAQTPPVATSGGPAAATHTHMHGHGGKQGHGRMDPAKRQAYVTKRLGELKQKLAITPAQEGAWTAFAAAHQPPATPMARPDREAMSRMTTPERIDQMRAMRTQRNAEMDRRLDATKSFYAALTPDQRKLFDEQTGRFAQRGGRHGGHHGGMHRG
ncbi:MAG: Spy/CpxP family protein refolding chaperone [Pseudomonadota bacterium]